MEGETAVHCSAASISWGIGELNLFLINTYILKKCCAFLARVGERAVKDKDHVKLLSVFQLLLNLRIQLVSNYKLFPFKTDLIHDLFLSKKKITI